MTDNQNENSREALEQRAKDLGVTLLLKVPKEASSEAVVLISEEVSRKYNLAIFSKDDVTATIHVAMRDPEDIDGLNILRFLAQKDNLNIQAYLATDDVLEDLQGMYGSAEKAISSAVEALDDDNEEIAKQQGKKGKLDFSQESLQDAPVAKLVQVIIRHALDGGASDIHIEPIDKTYRVRFRVDGVLHSSLTFPLEVGRAVVSRIKILSALKIDEKRKPQDGRFRIMEKGNAVDFRVSTLPVVEGEKVVMRVLEKDKQTFDLKTLGLMGSNHEGFMEHIRDPFGMILMTGPTGSGKSTTLYAFLKILNGEDGNIITLEDPVEYFIPGINQSQVKPEIGYTFASGLRSILRQDPDIIMVGEIRDGETAELAVHAALTGHLVFSTVHTNNAIGAIPRLMDMGIEPFLIGSSVRVIAAQRLLRRVCSNCKEKVEVPEPVMRRVQKVMENISAEEYEKYELDKSQLMVFYKGAGCDECGNLGMKGRVAIHEVVPVDGEMEDLISDAEGNLPALEEFVRERGYLSIKQDGVMKALLGLTTLAELERVTEGAIMLEDDGDEPKDEAEAQATQNFDTTEGAEPATDLGDQTDEVSVV